MLLNHTYFQGMTPANPPERNRAITIAIRIVTRNKGSRPYLAAIWLFVTGNNPISGRQHAHRTKGGLNSDTLRPIFPMSANTGLTRLPPRACWCRYR